MTWLIDTLLVTGALIALVLVLRRPVARWFGPGLAYALWALPLLRLAVPPLVLPASEPVPVVESAEAAAGAAAPGALAALAPATELAGQSALLTELAIGLWLAGALAFLVWRTLAYGAMRRLLLTGARPVGEASRVRLVESPATQAPVAFGVIDKVVALPCGFMNRGTTFERDLAIAHELQHHAGHDLAVNLAMQPLLALHWFNPLAWLGWRALRRDQEAACDARVLAGGDAQTRATYAALIASFAQSPRLALAAPMACPVLGEKSIIHRLRSLTMTPPSNRRRLLGRALLGAGLLALPLTASISYAASDNPAPPAAPEAPEAPEVVKAHHKIVIVDKQGGAALDEASLKTRVITKDGKTIVFKSDKDLSDADIEAKVAEAMTAMPDLPAAPAAPGQKRIVIKRIDQGGTADVEELSLQGEACDGTAISKVAASTKDGDKPQHVRIAICAKAHAKAAAHEAHAAHQGAKAAQAEAMAHQATARKAALSALRSARDEVAGDKDLTDKIRAEVTKQLDAEIERLSKEG